MKKLFALVLAIMLALSAVTVLAENSNKETLLKSLFVGTSGFALAVPADYYPAEISAEDTDISQVGYYVSDSSLVDFDVYQWVKAEGETLEAAATNEAAEYDASAEAITINDIPAFRYFAKEIYEDVEYDTVSYLMENDDIIAEIVFWLDGEDAMAVADSIINSLMISRDATIDEGGTEIVLGTSSLMITTPVSYAKGAISAEDTDENQVAYYTSADSLVDFDVYQWAKAEGETLEDVAAAEAAEYNAEIFEDCLDNGIILVGYYANEEYEGQTYDTCTLLVEDGMDFIELVFWLDGENAAEFMTEIVSTMKHI